MKGRIAYFAAVIGVLAGAFSHQALADVVAVQKELAAQGLYSGAPNGQMDEETQKAIRRYQLRNGLPVSGQLDAETNTSLGVAAGPSGTVTVVEEDQIFLKETGVGPTTAPPGMDDFSDLQAPVQEPPPSTFTPAPEPVAPPPAATPAPKPVATPAPKKPVATKVSTGSSAPGVLSDIFTGSPYASVGTELQRQVLRDAQRVLSRAGYYGGSIDGIAGPNTRSAISAFQRRNNLPDTGRLDSGTLQVMGLSGPGGGPAGGDSKQVKTASRPPSGGAPPPGGVVYEGAAVAVGPPPVVYYGAPPPVVYYPAPVRYYGPPVRTRVTIGVGRPAPRRGGVIVVR